MLCPRCFEKFAEKDTAFVCTDVRCPASAQSPRPLLQGTSSFFGGLKGPKCPQCNRQTSQKACPHCGMLLPHTFGEGKEVPIAIIGAKAAGKSNYIGVLIKMLRDQLGIAFNFSLVATGGDSTIRRYREDFYNPLFVKHVAVKASDATTEEIEPLMYSVLFQNERNKISRAVPLTIFDTAGENLDHENVMAVVNKYIYFSRGIILLLDPLQLPMVRESLKGKGINLPPSHTDPVDLLNRTIKLIREGRNMKMTSKIDIPIAVTFTKVDACRSLFDPSMAINQPSNHVNIGRFDEVDFNTINLDMQALVQEWYGGELLNLLKVNFEEYAFFGVSALGSDPDMNRQIPQFRPFRVEDPFFWLLWKNGILK